MQKITIKIDEYDVEMFKDLVAGKKEKIEWQMPTNEKEEIEIEFIRFEKSEIQEN